MKKLLLVCVISWGCSVIGSSNELSARVQRAKQKSNAATLSSDAPHYTARDVVNARLSYPGSQHAGKVAKKFVVDLLSVHINETNSRGYHPAWLIYEYTQGPEDSGQIIPHAGKHGTIVTRDR